MMQQHWRQLPVVVKELCQQSLTSDDAILESYPTNRSIIRPLLSSVSVCFITLLLISSNTGIAEAQNFESLSPADYFSIGCKGNYDASMFAAMDLVCTDCWNLFHDPRTYTLCRADCFNNNWFKPCVDTLQKGDQLETYKTYIQHLHRIPYDSF